MFPGFVKNALDGSREIKTDLIFLLAQSCLLAIEPHSSLGDPFESSGKSKVQNSTLPLAAFQERLMYCFGHKYEK